MKDKQVLKMIFKSCRLKVTHLLQRILIKLDKILTSLIKLIQLIHRAIRDQTKMNNLKQGLNYKTRVISHNLKSTIIVKRLQLTLVQLLRL